MTYTTTVTRLDGTTETLDPRTGMNGVISTKLTLEHSGMHEAVIGVPSGADPTDLALSDLDVDLDGNALFRGQIVSVEDTIDRGTAAVIAAGPGYAFTEAAPTSEVTYTDEWRYNAIDDYWTNNLDGVSASVTTYQPTPNILEDDVQIEDIPTLATFGTEFSAGSDVPVDIQASKIVLLQHGYIGFTSGFTGTFTTDSDDAGDSYFHIGGQWAIVDGTSEIVTHSETINHNIPSERVAGAIHIKANSSTSSVSDQNFTINGVRVGIDEAVNNANADFDPVDGNMFWFVFDNGEYDANGGTDLTAGNSYDISFDIDTAGDYEIDCMILYDTDYPPTTFDEPASFEDLIDGPSFYPGDVELTSVQHFEEANVQEARLVTTWNDTTQDQRLSLSPNDGTDYINASNATSLTADFDGNGHFGSVVLSKIRLSGTDEGDAVHVNQNATGQEITDYNLFVTVDDREIIDSLTLRDNHFQNLRDLHGGTWRFVTDPTVRSPVTVESFRDGRNGSTKTDTWTTVNAAKTRDVRNYANRILFIYNDTNGDFATTTIQRGTEITAKDGTTFQQVASTTENLTDAEANSRAREELSNAIAIDDTSGTIEAVAQLLLPGYTYTVPSWGDIQASVTRTSYTERQGEARMRLQFIRDRDLTQTVIQNKEGS